MVLARSQSTSRSLISRYRSWSEWDCYNVNHLGEMKCLHLTVFLLPGAFNGLTCCTTQEQGFLYMVPAVASRLVTEIRIFKREAFNSFQHPSVTRDIPCMWRRQKTSWPVFQFARVTTRNGFPFVNLNWA